MTEFRCVAPNGIAVREGIELSSAQVRRLPFGACFAVLERREVAHGLTRLRVAGVGGGWTSEISHADKVRRLMLFAPC